MDAHKLLKDDNIENKRNEFMKKNAIDIAKVINSTNDHSIVQLFNLIPRDKLWEVFSYIDIKSQKIIIEEYNNKQKDISIKENYFKTSPLIHAKKRILWLLFLTLSSFITGAIIGYYENIFLIMPAFVSFIPLLMGTGGNCGSQSATIIIRGLATGEVGSKDYIRIIAQESLIAIICGVILAIVNFIVVWLKSGLIMLATTVSLTTITVVLLSKIIGGVLPLLAKKLRLDPALMSSPIITTLLDCISIISYFLIAKIFLGI